MTLVTASGMSSGTMTTSSTKLLFVDIETYSEADLKTCGVYRYVDDPSFEVMLFGYAYGDDPVEVVDFASGESLPKQVLADMADPHVRKIAHNVPDQMARGLYGSHAMGLHGDQSLYPRITQKPRGCR